jgi:hypothetical protein
MEVEDLIFATTSGGSGRMAKSDRGMSGWRMVTHSSQIEIPETADFYPLFHDGIKLRWNNTQESTSRRMAC